MNWLAPVAGALLGAVGLNDVFHTLLHPGGRGRLTGWILQGIWRIAARLPARARAMAGPLGCVAVMLTWVGSQAFGWALIFLPLVPDGLLYSQGLDPRRFGEFAESLYLSLVALSTLGFGDIVVSVPVVRLLVPIEALVGLGLLTAAISWLLQLYPTLAARRALALRLTLLKENNFADFLTRDPTAGALTLHDLAGDIGKARVEMTQNQESYYFHVSDRRLSLPEALPYALALSDAASQPELPALAVSGALLHSAVRDFCSQIAPQARLAADVSVDEALRVYAADHSST